MRVTENQLASLLRGDRRADRAGCVDAPMLARFAAGALPHAERMAVLDHVAVCGDCAEEVRLLAPLEEWSGLETARAAAAGVRAPLFGTAAVWALAASIALPLLIVVVWQRSEIGELQRALDRAPVVVAGRRNPEPARPDLAPRVAALEAEIRDLAQPQLNPPIVDLEPDVLRGEAASNVITVPRGARFFNVILTAAGDATWPGYALEIRDRAGATVWRGSGLRRSEFGTFAAALPSSMLPAGRYELRILGVRGAREELLQRHSIDIRYR